MYSKPKRYENEAYLAFIRQQPCHICRAPGTNHPHHVETRGAGGSDLRAIPLCPLHHQEIHVVGVQTFAMKYRLEYIEVWAGLWEKFIRELM